MLKKNFYLKIAIGLLIFYVVSYITLSRTSLYIESLNKSNAVGFAYVPLSWGTIAESKFLSDVHYFLAIIYFPLERIDYHFVSGNFAGKVPTVRLE